MSTGTETGAFPRVRFQRRKDTRKLILRYHPAEDAFSLTIPSGIGEADVRAFLEQQRGWMDQQRKNRPWQPSYVAGERHLLWGRYVPLGGGELPVGQAHVLRAYAAALEAELNGLMPVWTRRMGVRVSRVTLKDMTSRWGSCSVQSHRIALNLRLALLPREFTAYVLVHELNHLLHPDHSADFYADMDRFYPTWREMREQIKACPLAPLPPV